MSAAHDQIGRTWAILGASSSIGRAFARAAAEVGADIVLAGRDVADLDSTAADIRARYGRKVETLALDAEAFHDHDAFVQRLADRPGGLDIFLLFGAMPGQEEIDETFTLLQRTVQVNYLGAVSLLHRLAPVLEQRRDGRVVVLTSVAGDRGRIKNYVYGSAKGALSLYLQGLRARLHRSGVTVTTVKAGFIDTDMTFGMPGLFLVASPEACAAACLRFAGKGKEVAYFPAFWWLIMIIIRHIPERIFKRLSI